MGLTSTTFKQYRSQHLESKTSSKDLFLLFATLSWKEWPVNMKAIYNCIIFLIEI